MSLKKLKNKKVMGLLIALAFVGCIGLVYAFFHNEVVKDNVFTAAKQDVHFEENFNKDTWPGQTTKEVNLVNDGNAPVIVRISYNEMWYKDDGGKRYTLSNKINNTDVVTKNWASTFPSDWTYSDGWYYYNHILDNGTSVQLLRSIVLNQSLVDSSPDKEDYSTFDYELSFNHEAVQADAKAVKELWGKNITINGKDIRW